MSTRTRFRIACGFVALVMSASVPSTLGAGERGPLALLGEAPDGSVSAAVSTRIRSASDSGSVAVIRQTGRNLAEFPASVLSATAGIIGYRVDVAPGWRARLLELYRRDPRAALGLRREAWARIAREMKETWRGRVTSPLKTTLTFAGGVNHALGVVVMDLVVTPVQGPAHLLAPGLVPRPTTEQLASSCSSWIINGLAFGALKAVPSTPGPAAGGKAGTTIAAFADEAAIAVNGATRKRDVIAPEPGETVKPLSRQK